MCPSDATDMSLHELVFQWTGTIKIQLNVSVYYKADLIIISLKINLLWPRYWKKQIAEKALTTITQSLTIDEEPPFVTPFQDILER